MKNVKLFEQFINEDVYQAFLGDLDSSAEILDAYSDGSGVQARSTNKTWDDGVPVLKYIGRARKKHVSIPKGEFKVVADYKYGWWYFKTKDGTWHGISHDDYDRPPFDY